MANIDDPRKTLLASGAPTIGNKPSTIPIFTTTYMKNAVPKP